VSSLAEERAEQQRWQFLPHCTGLDVYDRLIRNEFRSAADHREAQSVLLRRVVKVAARQAPYYKKLLARFGIDPAGIATPLDLPQLPTLRKADLFEHGEELKSAALPSGERLYGTTQSSGTTGRPVTVRHTVESIEMYSILRQRNFRWFRLDPMKPFLDVRPARDLARGEGGVVNPDGQVIRAPHWRYVATVFHTGPEYAFNLANPMERHLEWLSELRPAYALSYPGVFEEWLFANEGRNPAPGLEGLIGVGTQMPPSLRALLETKFGVPVHQTYGLNEIGMVAVRCGAGRYHVHTEHCLVEIVDDNGRASRPGENGRVLVTGLRNLAMPLLRYDTGDIAEAVDGPCACGRTLPSFGEIAGRYRRYAGLPKGTRERVRALRTAVESFPASELAFLRRYQVYQDLQDRFTLRLHAVSPIPQAFRDAMLAAWTPVAGSPLEIVEMAEIPSSPGGKLADFISEFHGDSAALHDAADRG
jgi:phenylacetate-coenzyme A ligase PaaK-like adenylate-forming protein